MAFPCPECKSEETETFDTRVRRGRVFRVVIWPPKVWRRRRCQACGKRFTTFETACEPESTEAVGEACAVRAVPV